VRCSLLIWIAVLGALAAPAGEEPAPKAAPPDPAGAVVPLKVFADRCFIPVTLNGAVACEAILDTGSEATLLNRARVEVKDLRPAGVSQLQGAHVGAVGAEQVVLDSLALGDCLLRNVSIGAIRHGKDQQLGMLDLILGMDVLGTRRFTLDFESRRFVWWAPKAALPPAGPGVERIRVPLGRSTADPGTRPWAEGIANGKHRALFLVDTGAGPVLLLNLKKPEDAVLPLDGPLCARLPVNDGGNRRELSIFRANLTKLELGHAAFENVSAEVLDASPVVGPVLRQELGYGYHTIGTTFLKTLKAVHFDFPGRAILLDRATNNAAPARSEPASPVEDGLQIGPRQ
jgi:hypothetical protein